MVSRAQWGDPSRGRGDRVSDMSPLACYDLGITAYEPLQQLQAAWRRAVASGAAPPVLLLLEHLPVVTLGMRADPLTSLVDGHPLPALPIARSERGGLATLHSPGQLISYPIMKLPHKDLRAYVWGLEEVVVRLLATYQLEAERRPGRPGVYVDGRKIASVGLRCERWVASHGTSLNVDPDLALFDRVVCCGDPSLRQTSLASLLEHAPTLADVKNLYPAVFAEVFGMSMAPLVPATREELAALLDAGAIQDRAADEGVLHEGTGEARTPEE